MNNVRKLNYEHAEKALEGLRRDPANKTYYDLAESMAKAEDFNIKNWESKISKFNELSEKVARGEAYFDNYQYILSPEYFSKWFQEYIVLSEKKTKLEPLIQEYKAYLELFTAYRAFSPSKKTVTEQLELITS